jgi:antitoxin ParD1/3/4
MTTSMNVSLPEALKEFVLERVAEQHFSNPSDYIRHLIREDRKRAAQEKLEAKLLEGFEGDPAELNDQDWASIREEVHRRRRAAESA